MRTTKTRLSFHHQRNTYRGRRAEVAGSVWIGCSATCVPLGRQVYFWGGPHGWWVRQLDVPLWRMRLYGGAGTATSNITLHMQGDCAEVVDVADSDISALSGEQQENRHGMHAPRVRNKKAHGAHPQNQNASEHNTQHAVRPLRAQQLLEHRNENQRTTSTLPKRDGGGGATTLTTRLVLYGSMAPLTTATEQLRLSSSCIRRANQRRSPQPGTTAPAAERGACAREYTNAHSF